MVSVSPTSTFDHAQVYPPTSNSEHTFNNNRYNGCSRTHRRRRPAAAPLAPLHQDRHPGPFPCCARHLRLCSLPMALRRRRPEHLCRAYPCCSARNLPSLTPRVGHLQLPRLRHLGRARDLGGPVLVPHRFPCRPDSQRHLLALRLGLFRERRLGLRAELGHRRQPRRSVWWLCRYRRSRLVSTFLHLLGTQYGLQTCQDAN